MTPSPKGHLSLVSVGPGTLDLVPERARLALTEAEVIVAYDLYLTWVRPLLRPDQLLLTPPLTQEKHRAELAIHHAQQGKRVALVSSGDIGIYAMAGLVFEELPPAPPFGVEVIPGITSATACASLLGSPLTHDFATLSLSDLLCPWEWIETRASHIAQADLACVLYNVQSRARQEGVYKVLRLMLEYKAPGTVCGVVRNAYREGQQVSMTTLSGLLEQQFDMLTTIIIGNRFTLQKGGWMYTPRGYNTWANGEQTPPSYPADAVWVYSGTADGNTLALQLAQQGYQVVLSAASELGKELAPRHPNLQLYAGPSGQEARRRALKKASALVDATHPYAQSISEQLQELAQELNLPYLRYQRPSTLPATLPDGVQRFATPQAAAQAAQRYGRVFLATGSKALPQLLPLLSRQEVYARLTPQPEVLGKALELGLKPQNLCAMIGPFSTDLNLAQWRAWNIEAVITKDSGAAGGFEAKYQAAQALGIPLLVIDRPQTPQGTFEGAYFDRASDLITALEGILENRYWVMEVQSNLTNLLTLSKKQ